MSSNIPQYPNWDGTSPTRARATINRAPDAEDWEQLVAETVAQQTVLQEVATDPVPVIKTSSFLITAEDAGKIFVDYGASLDVIATADDDLPVGFHFWLLHASYHSTRFIFRPADGEWAAGTDLTGDPYVGSLDLGLMTTNLASGVHWIKVSPTAWAPLSGQDIILEQTVLKILNNSNLLPISWTVEDEGATPTDDWEIKTYLSPCPLCGGDPHIPPCTGVALGTFAGGGSYVDGANNISQTDNLYVLVTNQHATNDITISGGVRVYWTDESNASGSYRTPQLENDRVIPQGSSEKWWVGIDNKYYLKTGVNFAADRLAGPI